MKPLVAILSLLLGLAANSRAATVFSDDFNRSVTNQTFVGNNWVETNSGLGDAVILTNQLVLKNGSTAGRTWVSQSTTNLSSPYTNQLNQNLDQVIWNFNMRSSRGGFSQLTGFDYLQYGIAFVVASSSSDFLSGTGYAVVWGQPGGITPLRLVSFNSGLTNNNVLSNVIVATTSSFTNVATSFLSVRVIYDPAAEAWELWARDDGASGFADPSSGSLTLLGRSTNSTYTGQPLGFMGALWNYNTLLIQYAYYDNFSVQALLRAPSIASPPASLLATLNASVSLNAGAVGARPLSYQWYFNGTPLGGETSAALTLPSFQPANEGSYSVVVTNLYGSATSAPAVLTLNRDYGDAPDPSYPSYLSNNGARHIYVPGYYLGSAVDGETNGQPNISATGDDLTSPNDDDGVMLTSPLIPGQVATLQVIASTNGYLNAWLDFNQNGSWADAGEQIFVNQSLSPGVNNLSFSVSGAAAAGANAYARFRFSSATGLSFTGEAPDGEVEDYQFAINAAAYLAVSVSGAPNPVAVGSNLTYTIVVTNRGPSQASGVIATFHLPSSIFVSANASQGSCSQSGGTVICDLGMLLSGFKATVAIMATPNVAASISGLATVAANEPDSDLSNNSASATTTVLNRPVITAQPQNFTVTNGNTALFSVAASGTGTLLYQWQFNGANLTNRTNATLTLANAQLANAGAYDAVVSDDVGYVISSVATLVVLVPPSITTQPLSQTGNVGGYITFSVTASGTSPLNYQWYFNTTTALSGATAAILTLTNLQTTNAGNYTVAVANSAGAVTSAVAALTVKAMDFGDAPDGSYPSLLSHNGARHIIVPGIYLGTGVSQDSDGKPNAAATGDDFDDGITFTNTFVAGQTAWVKVVASTNGYLSAWLDFSQDGSWAQGGDQVFDGQPVVKGTNLLSFEVPYFAQAGTTFARFRFTTNSNSISFDGMVADGEVEDYAVTINPATATQLVIGSQPAAFVNAGDLFDPPPQIYVADNRGNPVFSDSSTVVTAARLAGAGTLLGTLTTTTSHGVASFANLYHTLATNITLKFTAGTFAVTSSVVEVDAGPATQLGIQRQPSATATAGVVFSTQPIVQVQDAFGNLITNDSGRIIVASRNLGSGSLQGNTSANTVSGLATFSALFHAVANTINLEFDTAGLTSAISSNIVVSPATASRLVFTTQPGSAVAGASFGVQPVVKTQDTNGNNSNGGLGSSKTVTVSLSSGTGPLQGTTTLDIGTSAGNGTVTFTNLLLNAAGTNDQLTASVTSGLISGSSSNFTVNPAPFARMQLLVPGESPAPGTGSGKTGTPSGEVTDGPFTVTVNAVDTNWNLINTVADTVGITSSDASATLPGNAVLTGGTATLPFSFNTAGSQTITVSNLTGLTGLAGRTNTSPSITVNAAPYTAATGGNAISADTVNGAFTSLTGPIYQEAAAASVSTGTVDIVCPPGFTFDTGGTAPTVKLEGTTGGNNHLINNAANGSNAPVSLSSSQITFTVTSPSSSTTTKLTWQNLRVRPSAGTPLVRCNLTESGTATLAGVRTNSNFGTLREIVGAANKLAINTQPSSVATAGVAFAQQPVIGVADQFGNLRSTNNGAADNSTIVTAARSGGNGTLQGTLTASATDGLASFSTINHQLANTINLSFSSGILGGVTSAPVQVNAAMASRLAYIQQPGSGVVGSNLSVQPVVVSSDAFGNNSTVGLPANLALTMALAPGTGSLLGTTNLDIGTAVGNGSVSFTNLRVDSAGTKQLTASAAGLGSSNSAIFSVGKGDQTINFASLTDKTYGNSPFPLSATASSGLAVSFGVFSGPASVSGTTASITRAGGVVIRASQAGDANYNAAPSVNQGFTVNAAPLSVTANSYTRDYGTANPIFTGSIVGIQNSDNITGTYSTTATIDSSPGTYSIVPAVIDPDNKLPNYSASFANGVLTVSSVPRIVDVSESNGVLTLSFTTETGRTYRIEYKDFLTDLTWTTKTTVTGTGSVMTITDDISSIDSRFYRVVLQ